MKSHHSVSDSKPIQERRFKNDADLDAQRTVKGFENA